MEESKRPSNPPIPPNPPTPVPIPRTEEHSLLHKIEEVEWSNGLNVVEPHIIEPWVAVSSQSGEIYIYDYIKHWTLKALTGVPNPSPITQLLFWDSLTLQHRWGAQAHHNISRRNKDPESRLVVVRSKSIIIWDYISGEEREIRSEEVEGKGFSIAEAVDREYLGVGMRDGSILLYRDSHIQHIEDIDATASPTLQLQIIENSQHSTSINALKAFQQDLTQRPRLIAASQTLAMWNMETCTDSPAQRFIIQTKSALQNAPHESQILHIGVQHAIKEMATYGGNKSICIWDLHSSLKHKFTYKHTLLFMDYANLPNLPSDTLFLANSLGSLSLIRVRDPRAPKLKGKRPPYDEIILGNIADLAARSLPIKGKKQEKFLIQCVRKHPLGTYLFAIGGRNKLLIARLFNTAALTPNIFLHSGDIPLSIYIYIYSMYLDGHMRPSNMDTYLTINEKGVNAVRYRMNGDSVEEGRRSSISIEGDGFVYPQISESYCGNYVALFWTSLRSKTCKIYVISVSEQEIGLKELWEQKILDIAWSSIGALFATIPIEKADQIIIYSIEEGNVKLRNLIVIKLSIGRLFRGPILGYSTLNICKFISWNSVPLDIGVECAIKQIWAPNNVILVAFYTGVGKVYKLTPGGFLEISRFRESREVESYIWVGECLFYTTHQTINLLFPLMGVVQTLYSPLPYYTPKVPGTRGGIIPNIPNMPSPYPISLLALRNFHLLFGVMAGTGGEGGILKLPLTDAFCIFGLLYTTNNQYGLKYLQHIQEQGILPPYKVMILLFSKLYSSPKHYDAIRSQLEPPQNTIAHLIMNENLANDGDMQRNAIMASGLLVENNGLTKLMKIIKGLMQMKRYKEALNLLIFVKDKDTTENIHNKITQIIKHNPN